MATLSVLRMALLTLLLLGNIGTLVELLLLKHTDGIWQLAPLMLSGATLLVLAWFGVTRSARALRALQVVMVCCFLSGGVGVVQHLRGNLGYAKDSNPSLSGRDLYIEAVMGSTPTLAPGMMVQLALIGLAFVFRHPRLRGAANEDDLPSSRIDV
jgi:hypothetical protein